jgi:hypothetical protein
MQYMIHNNNSKRPHWLLFGVMTIYSYYVALTNLKEYLYVILTHNFHICYA